MKKFIGLFSTTFLLLIIFPCLTFSQDTEQGLNRSIVLSGDSKTEEIIIKVDEQTLELSLSVKSSVSKGKLSIEIYDPKGEAQGNFSVGTQLNSNKGGDKETGKKEEVVSGRINKLLNDPIRGNWIIKIIPDQAMGKIDITSIHHFKSKK